ncbi:aldo/keto reductase [Oceaniradius stylonematis]|uniref:aldo/keto reductase n=1 Tax=Oceaniradius stylonematis TaxID=2184161 RepID=UPI00273FC06F|nr:aldo/keto reductase [Oceaniradius stylonematis]
MTGGTQVKVAQRRAVKRAGLELTALGLGCAAFGGLYRSITASDALAALRTAWQAGIRHFDTAPMYGLGRAEHLLGHFLREGNIAPGEAVISTKVGRLMALPRPGRELPPEPPKNPFDTGWSNGLRFREVFDYSYDGLMRSFDDSQQRLGLPDIDLLFVHDIGRVTHGERHDRTWRDLTGGGFRALRELKAAGLIKGFGLGVNETRAIDEAMNETDIDCCLLAGRYTLLDRSGEALLATAKSRDVAIVAGGVYNSGILAAGNAGDRKFDYRDAPPEIVGKVDRLAATCARFDVPLGAAALQFPMRNEAVTSVLVGARTAEDVASSVDWFECAIPDALWSELDAAA